MHTLWRVEIAHLQAEGRSDARSPARPSDGDLKSPGSRVGRAVVRAVDLMTGLPVPFLVLFDSAGHVLGIRYPGGRSIPRNQESFTEVEDAFHIDRQRWPRPAPAGSPAAPPLRPTALRITHIGDFNSPGDARSPVEQLAA